ncbi:initiation factor 5a [Mycena olivaceomarginata]|nr:initiation factor 5a [Mycena olivaceomarginata]
MPNVQWGVDLEEVGTYAELETRARTAESAPTTFSVCAAALHKHHHVVLQGRPGRIVHLSHSRAGYSYKMHMVTLDIFAGRKMEHIMDVKHFIDAPVLTHSEYTLVNIDAPILNLLTDEGEPKDDVDVSKDTALCERLAGDFALGKDLRVKTVVSYEEAAAE